MGTGVASDLSPETVHTYEAVWEQQLGPHFRATVDGYYNDIKDVISRVRDFGADPFDPYDDTVNVINRHIRTHGVEFELEGVHASGVRGRVSYAWQKARDVGLDQGLGNSPQHLAKLNLDIPLYRDKVFAGLEARYQSGVSTVYNTRIQPFWVLNATLFSANLTKNLEVSGSIYNLLDERYDFPGSPEHTQDRIPQTGRTFRLKATYRC
jgi:iron complex outermembrane receptor protein